MATNWNAVLANITNSADILAILRKVLGLLDGKVDLTKIDEIIQDITNMETDVKSALINVSSALTNFNAESQEAIQQVIAAGLMEGFATEAELLATRPTVLKKYSKAEDTDVIWFWNKPEGAPDGNYWTSTGLSELAQSKIYTDQKTIEVNSHIEDVADRTKNLSSIIEEALFVKVDVNDQVVEFTDINGGLHLTNLPKTVQDSFLELDGAKSVTTVNRTTVTHIFSDNNENVIAYLKSDGNLVLIGLDGSVQSEFAKLNLSDDEIREKTKSLEASNNLSDITHIFSDSAENVVAYIKNDGGLFLVGLTGSLQSNFTALVNRATALEQNLQKLRDEVAVDEILIQKDLVPQNYSIDAVQALSIKCDYPSNIQGFFPDSPYRLSDSPTHPCVIELARPLRGYKYLMVQTPYYENNPLEENPCIYGSNDMATWTMFKDMPQPLDEPPTWDESLEGKSGYLSDPWWTYDHITKELYCCYRKAYTVGPNQYNPTDIMQLLYRKTSNGIHWSKPQKLFGDIENGVDPIISPAIIYDFKNKVWCMFYFKSVRSFAMRTNPDFRNPNGWSAPIDLGYESWIAANNPPQLGWHLDVRYIGDRLFAMINDSTNAKLYLAYADKDDFTKWTFTSSSVLNTPPPRNSCYKGSMIAVPVDSTQMKLHVIWTDAGGYRRLFNAKTFPISIV
ncbi:hypothetical protein IEC338SC_3226 [Acinetobacter pittii]|uniref:Uncharacterized protein n=1 Tax=Acinetobacter pittii TaxID=48296 RepID=A0AB33BN26_ACIPI|nr:sialidase family protein [Acinetobacter pittii]AMX20337.1 hypothetical protein IEC338SC_3226 [Acinetobacter pittii]